MALAHRGHVRLAHRPPVPSAAVDLSRVIRRELGRFVLHDEPLHAVHGGLTRAEVVGVAPEHGLHVGVVALEDERPSAHGGLSLLEVAELLHCIARYYPRAGEDGDEVNRTVVRTLAVEWTR